jgi:hypothetical protein
MAAPSINAAVNAANHAPPADRVNSAPNRLAVTEPEATGISPSSNPSKNSARNAAASTAARDAADSSMAPGGDDMTIP